MAPPSRSPSEQSLAARLGVPVPLGAPSALVVEPALAPHGGSPSESSASAPLASDADPLRRSSSSRQALAASVEARSPADVLRSSLQAGLFNPGFFPQSWSADQRLEVFVVCSHLPKLLSSDPDLVAEFVSALHALDKFQPPAHTCLAFVGSSNNRCSAPALPGGCCGRHKRFFPSTPEFLTPANTVQRQVSSLPCASCSLVLEESDSPAFCLCCNRQFHSDCVLHELETCYDTGTFEACPSPGSIVCSVCFAARSTQLLVLAQFITSCANESSQPDPMGFVAPPPLYRVPVKDASQLLLNSSDRSTIWAPSQRSGAVSAANAGLPSQSSSVQLVSSFAPLLASSVPPELQPPASQPLAQHIGAGPGGAVPLGPAPALLGPPVAGSTPAPLDISGLQSCMSSLALQVQQLASLLAVQSSSSPQAPPSLPLPCPPAAPAAGPSSGLMPGTAVALPPSGAPSAVWISPPFPGEVLHASKGDNDRAGFKPCAPEHFEHVHHPSGVDYLGNLLGDLNRQRRVWLFRRPSIPAHSPLGSPVKVKLYNESITVPAQKPFMDYLRCLLVFYVNRLQPSDSSQYSLAVAPSNAPWLRAGARLIIGRIRLMFAIIAVLEEQLGHHMDSSALWPVIFAYLVHTVSVSFTRCFQFFSAADQSLVLSVPDIPSQTWASSAPSPEELESTASSLDRGTLVMAQSIMVQAPSAPAPAPHAPEAPPSKLPAPATPKPTPPQPSQAEYYALQARPPSACFLCWRRGCFYSKARPTCTNPIHPNNLCPTCGVAHCTVKDSARYTPCVSSSIRNPAPSDAPPGFNLPASTPGAASQRQGSQPPPPPPPGSASPST